MHDVRAITTVSNDTTSNINTVQQTINQQQQAITQLQQGLTVNAGATNGGMNIVIAADGLVTNDQFNTAINNLQNSTTHFVSINASDRTSGNYSSRRRQVTYEFHGLWCWRIRSEGR